MDVKKVDQLTSQQWLWVKQHVKPFKDTEDGLLHLRDDLVNVTNELRKPPRQVNKARVFQWLLNLNVDAKKFMVDLM